MAVEMRRRGPMNERLENSPPYQIFHPKNQQSFGQRALTASSQTNHTLKKWSIFYYNSKSEQTAKASMHF